MAVALIVVAGVPACSPRGSRAQISDGGADLGGSAGATTVRANHACVTNADCADPPWSRCYKSACDASEGTCQLNLPCGDLDQPPVFCGCDGQTYPICAGSGEGISAAYAGPCRTLEVVACDHDHVCPPNQLCAPDPRAGCAPGQTCPGVCLTPRPFEPCGPSSPDGGDGPCQCGHDSVCVLPAEPTCVAGNFCGQCVYGTGLGCSDTSPCPAGQLCVPALRCPGDVGLPARECVVP